MQDLNFESLERVKEAHSRVQRILENRDNIISNNIYDVKQDNNLITRINELLLESYEDLQKLPAEVDQLVRGLLEEEQQIYEARFKDIHDEFNELIRNSNEFHKKNNFTNKMNKRLSFLCGLLIPLLISSVIINIMLLKQGYFIILNNLL